MLDVFKKLINKNIENEGTGGHPELTSKNIWNSRIAETHHKLRLWQLVTLVSLFITLASVGGIVLMASKSKYIPYIVEVDKLGEVVVIKEAQEGTVKDTRIIRAKIAEFITGLRVVTFDNTLQRTIVFQVYSSLRKGEPAINKVNLFYKNDDTNPFIRSEQVTVGIEILSLVASTETTYQIDWRESTYNNLGVLRDVKTYRSLVTIYLVDTAVENVKDLTKNPLGIYIRDFNITELRI